VINGIRKAVDSAREPFRSRRQIVRVYSAFHEAVFLMSLVDLRTYPSEYGDVRIPFSTVTFLPLPCQSIGLPGRRIYEIVSPVCTV
jgi:hypothetical protein